jgi:superfamily II DNA or RNA helicase
MDFMFLGDIQKEALSHIKDSFDNNINPICALDMGLGKTRVACKIIENIMLKKPLFFRILVIIKVSNYQEPWVNELVKCNIISSKQDNKLIYIHGKERLKYLHNNKYHFPNGHILFTSYDTLRIDLEKECYDTSSQFDLIIYDELHTIINSKRPTQKSIVINNLRSIKKLALTGTAIQNDTKELGLIYLFLNDNKSFLRLIDIFADNTTANKMTEINTVLEGATEKCINDQAMFYHSERKQGFEKYAVIFSIPIDEEMYQYAVDNFEPFEPRQLMFLSHPDSVLTDEEKKPVSMKAEAVKIILRSALPDEKIIIFSRYISVLDAYFYLCKEEGFQAVKITGNDKGKRLEEKLNMFEYSPDNRVLLTTLQKSSEGFNFQFATHVIILEFWWNPQKIIQAMSRIDRRTQKRNIFVYLLCYNYNKEIIEIEDIYLDKMLKKVEEANNTYKKTNGRRLAANGNLSSVFHELPKIEQIDSLSNFSENFERYILSFQHTDLGDRKQIYDNLGKNLNVSREKIYTEVNNYLQCFQVLSLYPWRIIYPEIQDYLFDFYSRKLLTNTGMELIDKARNQFTFYKYDVEKSYSFIFIRKIIFPIKLNNKIEHHGFTYVIGKNKEGKLSLLNLYMRYKGIGTEEILDDLIKLGVTDVSSFIIARESLIHRKQLREIINRHFDNANWHICLTSFFSSLIKYHDSLLNSNELFGLENIFSLRSKYQAKEAIGSLKENWYNKHALNMFNKFIDSISPVYQYTANIRPVIGTTNIILLISIIVQQLLNREDFRDINTANRYINHASRIILDNGKKYIPNWEKLNAPINAL